MSADALVLRELRLRRAPGIRESFALTGLTYGINIVFGPNGSGKTTTAGALEAAIWSAHTDGTDLSLDARFALHGVEWQVQLDGGRARVQRDGRDAAAPVLPAAESRHRYRLHLHELLAGGESGGDFARLIVRESTGGYDLPGAAERLQLAKPGPQAGQREAGRWQAARKALAEATARQRAVDVEAGELRDLDARIAAARAARAQVTVLDAAIAHANARVLHDAARATLATFDSRCERLTGHEMVQLDELRARIEQASATEREARERLARSRAAMERLLPGGELAPGLLPELRTELRTIEELRRQRATEDQAVNAAAERAAAAARQLGELATEARLGAIDAAAMSELARLADEVERLAAQRHAGEAALAALGPAEAAHDEQALRQGMSALEAWLGTAPPAESDRRLRVAGIVAAILAMLLGAGVALQEPAVGAAGALVAIVLLSIMLRRQPQADPRPSHAETYRRLGFPVPAEWTHDAVATALDELRRRAAAARLEERLAAERARLQRVIAELAPREAELETRRRAAAERLGVTPGTPPRTLAWIAEGLARWQQARAEVVSARAAHVVTCAAYDGRRATLQARLAPLAPVASATESALAAAVDALETRLRAHAEQQQAGELAEREARSAAEAQERARVDRAAIFRRLELEEAEEEVLRQWCASLDRYRDARDRALEAMQRWRLAADALHALYGADDRLSQRGAAELELERDDAARVAAEHEQLVSRRAALETRVDHAKRSSEVAAAMADERRCEDALMTARDRDMERAVGAALVESLLAETRDQQRPAVFHRARELFLGVTDGRYRLDLADGDEPAFFAHDTRTGMGHSLGELSSATRVQLLLCVRLAFVETQENGGPRLPLLLDETLGTSDDARAQTIIDTILDLAAEGGRQVFYFTAQRDEVEKWLGAIEARGADGFLVDLQAERRLGQPVAPFVAAPVPPRAAPPAPDDCSHVEYGARLRVPAIDLDAETIGGAHLWYLTDDPVLLHRLLGLRQETWGPLEMLLDAVGPRLLGDAERAVPGLRAAATALREAHRLARVGRGRRVDRAAIEASGAVSAVFMDRVLERCTALDGDAAGLMEFVERDLDRFQRRSCERLRDHLVEHGYLATEASLGREEILARTIAAVGAALGSGALGYDHVERLVDAVRPARGGQPAAPVPAPVSGRPESPDPLTSRS